VPALDSTPLRAARPSSASSTRGLGPAALQPRHTAD
jgi:hypothetical protein